MQKSGVAPTDDCFTLITSGPDDTDQDGPALVGDPVFFCRCLVASLLTNSGSLLTKSRSLFAYSWGADDTEISVLEHVLMQYLCGTRTCSRTVIMDSV